MSAPIPEDIPTSTSIQVEVHVQYKLDRTPHLPLSTKRHFSTHFPNRDLQQVVVRANGALEKVIRYLDVRVNSTSTRIYNRRPRWSANAVTTTTNGNKMVSMAVSEGLQSVAGVGRKGRETSKKLILCTLYQYINGYESVERNCPL